MAELDSQMKKVTRFVCIECPSSGLINFGSFNNFQSFKTN